MQIIDNKALLLKLKEPHRVTQVIPKSKLLDSGEVLVKWGLEEAQVLKNLRIKGVPSPIVAHYDWPGLYKPFAHQKTTAEFLTLHRRAFCFNEQGCVDSDTEYLSPTGWVKISEYSGGPVAQYLPDSGAIEFVDPIEYVKLPCENMVRIKTKYGVDQLLSPEHRVLLVDGKKNTPKTEVLHADELLARHDAYHAGTKATVVGTKKGTSSIAFSAAAVPTAFTTFGGSGISLTDAELRVQVAVIADGYFGNNNGTCVVRLKRERKIARMCMLLEEASIEYTKRDVVTGSAKGFSIFTFTAPLRLKVFDSRFWGASADQLKVIADEVLRWDGSVRRGCRYFSNSKESADFVQYVFSATGNTARITEDNHRENTNYVVTVRPAQKRLFIRGTKSTMHVEKSTDGFKYCFMVPSTFLLFRRNGCVFASGNTGKTGSVIWAADYLMKIGMIRRVLVICPLSIMQSAWQNDLFRFAMHRTVGIAHSHSREKRIEVVRSDAEFVVVNFDGLDIIKDEVLKQEFDLIVVDEANAYKTHTTKRWKVLNHIIKPETWIWMLTGTPASQAPTDAYGIAKIINPNGIPKYFSAFKEQVMQKVTMFKWVPRPRAEAIIHQVLQPAIRFTKEECLDLPEMTYVTRDVPLTTQQKKYYETLRKHMVATAAGEEISTVNAAANLNKLLQLSGGAVYSDSGEVIAFDASNRMEALKEVIDEASHKVIVFVPYRHAIHIIEEELTKSGYSCAVIHGGVSVKARNDIFTRFQTEDTPRVLVIQPQAASHGVTLHAANIVVYWSPVMSVETYLQANARVHRAGQRNPCTVVHLQGSPVEKKMYAMLESKVDIHTRVVDLYKNLLDES